VQRGDHTAFVTAGGFTDDVGRRGWSRGV
jgi:hypothetical protein